ncbi:MAG: IS1096 element passenger TnpR family protein [Pirellulaceae bacterium]
MCLKGERACPPEGCGGAERYAEMLDILADPADEHHGNVAEWLGRFDAESFSAESATRKMRYERP